MLNYAILFFVAALAAVLVGFGGPAVGLAGIARLFFGVAVALSVVTFIAALVRRR